MHNSPLVVAFQPYAFSRLLPLTKVNMPSQIPLYKLVVLGLDGVGRTTLTFHVSLVICVCRPRLTTHSLLPVTFLRAVILHLRRSLIADYCIWMENRFWSKSSILLA